MLVMPNFDDPVFEEAHRGPGGKSKSKLKRRASKQAKRGKTGKRAGVGRLKRARSSR